MSMFQRFLQSIFAPRRRLTQSAPNREKHCFVPRVEPLENRVAPAIDFVTNLGGGNTAGSLKAVVTSASAGDTIEFQTSGIINLTGGPVVINQNLTIDGTGANIIVSGQNAVRDFLVTGGNVFINNLTMTGANSGNFAGGAIGKIGGSLTLANDVISNNTGRGGAAISNVRGALTLNNCVVTNNTAGGNGGGIFNQGNLTLNNDTLANNTASFRGGALDNLGGTATVNNCTLANNTAMSGGGLYNDASSFSPFTPGNLTLSNATVTNNTATSGRGGGIANQFGCNLSLYDTIVAGNNGFNLSNGGTYTNNGGNLTSGNVMLGPLQFNGGPTETIAPLPGSPALGAGLTAGIPPTATDQRGFQRIVNGKIDVGAYETQIISGLSISLTNKVITLAGQGTSLSGSFSDPNATLTHTVTVSWGDGSADTVVNLAAGVQTFSGIAHTYTVGSSYGLYPVNVTVTDNQSPPGGTGASLDILNPVVTTAADFSSAGVTTLRDAINAVNTFSVSHPGAYTISFAPNVTGTITLVGSGLPAIASNVTIQGPGANVLAVSGNNSFQVFHVSSGTVFINGLTISDGSGGGSGGGVYNAGTLTLTNDTLANNTALNGGAVINRTVGNLTLIGDTFTGNNATSHGGALFNLGTASAINDTFSGNNAPTSGGGAIMLSKGNLTLAHDTITGNMAATGGGIQTNSGQLNLFDNIVDGNTSPNGPNLYVAGMLTSSGGNLYGPSNVALSGSFLDSANNPGLGSLQNNGGPTQTMAELPGSPALTKGVTTGAPATDQRGFTRVVNNLIDIGAFENQIQSFSTTPPSAQNVVTALSASVNLGSFGYTGSATGNFTIDVNWGDNTADTTFTVASAGSLGTQGHTYASSKAYTITITITDSDSNFVQMTGSVTASIPTTVYVDQTFAGTSPGANPATAPTGLTLQFGFNAYADIQSGLNAVASGGNIVVFADSSKYSGFTVNNPATFDINQNPQNGSGSTVVFIGTGITLNADVTFTQALFPVTGNPSLPAADLTFNNIVTGGTPVSLTVNGNSNNDTFDGSVGNTTGQLKFVDIASSNAITLTQSVNTTGGQTYGASTFVENSGQVTLTGSTVNFEGTLQSQVSHGNLTIAGNATFGNVVGDILGADLNNLQVNGTTTINTTRITTLSAQTYNDAVTLGSNTTLASTGGAPILFSSTIQSPGTAFSLTVNTGTSATFDDVVGGGGNPLSFINIGSGTSTLLTDNVTTTGGQTYNAPVDVKNPGTVTLTGSTISFPGSVQSFFSTGNLTIAGNAVFGGTGADLNSLLVTGTTEIDTTSIGTFGSQTYTGAVTLDTGTQLFSSTGNITLASTLQSPGSPFGLLVNAVGTITFGGAVGGSGNPLGALTIEKGGTTQINGGSINTSGFAQTYNNNVTFGQTFTLLAGIIDFNAGLTLGTNKVQVAGTLNFANTTTVSTTFAGTSPSQVGHIIVSNLTNFNNATLAVSYQGFTPSPGNSFDVVSNGAFTVGQFINAPVPGVFSFGGVLYTGTYSGSAGGSDFIMTVLAGNQAYVEALYQTFLGRTGSPSEWAGWIAALNTQGRAAVVAGIEYSSEASNRLVNEIYERFLGRSSTGDAGAQVWVNMLTQKGTEEAVIAGILSTSAFAGRANALIGTSSANYNYVQALYSLLLNRTGSAAEVNGWLAQMPALSRSQIAADFQLSPEYRRGAVSTFYGQVYRVLPYQPYFPDFLHRSASASEVAGWVNLPLALLGIEQDFAASNEFYNDNA